MNTRQRLPRHLVLEARRQRAAGYTITEIAKSLGRSRSSISAICNGRSYQRVKDLPDTPPLRQAPDDEQ